MTWWVSSPAVMGQAIQAITAWETEMLPAVESSHTVPGWGFSGFSDAADYTIRFGQGGDLKLTGISTGSTDYVVSDLLQTVVSLRRNPTIPGIPADQQIIWYRTVGAGYEDGSIRNVQPTRAPDLEAALAGDVMNRGTDNMFQNLGDGNGNINNIERADFVFSGHFLQPQNEDHLNSVGFAIVERGGNDSFLIAAITELDEFGDPSAFAEPVSISAGWGAAPLWTSQTLVLRGDQALDDGSYRPSTTVNDQSAYGLFFTLEDLGAAVGESIYGYSLFAGDTTWGGDTSNLLDWTNPQFFPTDTPAATGGMDLVSGGSGILRVGLDTTGLIIPEPGSAMLAFLGGGLLMWSRRRAT